MKYNIGDIRNGLPVLPMDDRRTILLLSDDLRMSSGIASVSKELVLGLAHRYKFVQLGAAINHPEQGKELDLSQDTCTQTGLDETFVRVVPWNGYGDANILRQMMMKYRPNAIMIFTDPRYFRWIFDMESEIRENVPILFYTIWDNLPAPMYNAPYYASCDGLFCISKQTYGIVNNVLDKKYKNELILK